MTKIGVISDTHLKKPDRLLEEVAKTHFADVDMILHAGDLITLDVLRVFDGKAVIAVSGNNDRSVVKAKFPQKEIVTIGRVKIGLVHGWGWPFGLLKRVASQFDGVDCIVFGHSHSPVNRYRKGTLFFNPGGFCGGFPVPWQRSIGLLRVDNEIRGEIIKL